MPVPTQKPEVETAGGGRRLPMNFRLGAPTRALLRAYSQACGRTQTEVIESAVAAYCTATLESAVAQRLESAAHSLEVSGLGPKAAAAFAEARARLDKARREMQSLRARPRH